MVTLAVPGPEIKSIEIVTCNCWPVWTVVLSVVPLMITTEDETKFLPLTVSTNPCCTWANVIVLADSDPMTGAGRELPHNGLSELQPGRITKASTIAQKGHRTKATRPLGLDSALELANSFANAVWYIK